MEPAENPVAVSVSVVEDDPDFQESLAQLVQGCEGLRYLGAYSDGAEAIKGLPADRPEVVLLDIQMPRATGIDCIRALKPEMPETQFVVLTSHSDDERLFQALEAGATGYLLKRCPPQEIIEAIMDARAGGSPMSSYIARRVVRSFSKNSAPESPPATPPSSGSSLSPREAEILALLTQGFLYKEIADRLHISIDTVRTHLRRIYEKLQVRSRTEAVVKFLKA